MKAPHTGTTERLGLHLAASAFEEAGFAFREQTIDFGIDAVAERVVEESATGQLVALQIKSGPRYFAEATDNEIVFRTDRNHGSYWLDHSLPVLICLCDVGTHTVHWEVVTSKTLVSTGKGYKLLVPRGQVVGPSQSDILAALVTPVVPASRYTVVGPEDVSHGLAKRYSFKVLLNGSATRAESTAILRQVTSDGAKRSYSRNATAEQRWGDADADVVWVYLYPSAQDLATSNAVVRSQWIRESLDHDARPLKLVGEDAGDGLTIVWNTGYSTLANLVSEATVTKEAYLSVVDRILVRLLPAQIRLADGVTAVSEGRVRETAFIKTARRDFKIVEEADDELSKLGAAPFECNDLDLKLLSVIAHLANVVLYFSAETFLSRPPSNRIRLASGSLADAGIEIDYLKYERQKAR